MSDPKPAEAKELAERLLAASSNLLASDEAIDAVCAAREAMNEARQFVLTQAEQIAELEAAARTKDKLPGPGLHRCPTCGQWSRDTTAGCDHCDMEDK